MHEMAQTRIFYIILGLVVFWPILYFLRKIDRCKDQERSHCFRSLIAMVFFVMVFFGSMLALFIIARGLDVGLVVPVALFLALAYWFIKTPYEMSIDEDGSLTLKHIFQQKRVKPAELRSLKNNPLFIKLSYDPAGTVFIPNFPGRHDFINLLKEANPDLNTQDL